MPELPEVETLSLWLTEKAAGSRVERAELASLSALRTWEPPLQALVGATLDRFERRGKYLCAKAGGGRVWMVVHLARGGWVQWRDTLNVTKARPGKGPLALRVGLSGGAGFDVTEQGTEKRLAIWIVNDPRDVEGIARLGPEPLEPGFGVDELAAALSSRSGNLKSVLVDQSVLAGVGNAYSDEILHAARLSPYKPTSKLDPEELAALHGALLNVLSEAVTRSAGLPARELKGEKRSGMAVHGRSGEPCPVCGDTVAEVSFATRSLQYCPTCQTNGRRLADRRMSRLLR